MEKNGFAVEIDGQIFPVNEMEFDILTRGYCTSKNGRIVWAHHKDGETVVSMPKEEGETKDIYQIIKDSQIDILETKNALKVMLFLGLYGKAMMKEISPIVSNYRTLQDTLRTLEKAGLIKTTEEIKHRKIVYNELTNLGLLLSTRIFTLASTLTAKNTEEDYRGGYMDKIINPHRIKGSIKIIISMLEILGRNIEKVYKEDNEYNRFVWSALDELDFLRKKIEMDLSGGK